VGVVGDDAERNEMTKGEDNRRKARAKLWVEFRNDFLLTQNQLAELIGISRRMVQYVESAKVTPDKPIQSRFLTLYKQYHAERQGKPLGKRPTRYRVFGDVSGRAMMGVVEAETEKEAIRIADEERGGEVKLCQQCSTILSEVHISAEEAEKL
jgi:DNA-binding XRE family transcriptional regulator